MATQSYLGIISKYGLEYFVPETSHAARFCLRRAYRMPPSQSVCCWAVLDEQHVGSVVELLSHGSQQAALEAMHANSLTFGTLLPLIDDDAVPIAL